ncbi:MULTISPECIES: periplasmic heavy metal sensor [unclassified Sphingomonas]|uniref:periplasmic heavy metal sensor n=1 Tax=unclassified Sphingomonas TaxID=196159 RepID=UPI00092B7B30|nr:MULTISPECIES: periplasmic heavy metal sensor [unclassified Sphingomonas]MBN8847929.1 periplasmic heavy metal sensor [Sphingomonas sp.]OJV34175.1 MAG: hypothetical protein BGO24_13515 [Sphingomonas sp. 67-36]
MSLRTLKAICAVSILLNIFLIAGVAASLLWVRAQRPMIGAGAMRIAGAELPRAERRAFRQALRAARRDAAPLAATDRQARQEAAALLRAPTVDPAALAAALGRVRDADLAVRAQTENGVAGFVATLPQADRARLADSLERRGARQRR